MSKDKFDLDRVSRETMAAYERAILTEEIMASSDGLSSKELQAVIDEARVPPPPKTLREILDEGLCVGLDAEDYQVLIHRAREALKRQEWRDSLVADVVRAAKIFALRCGTSGHDRALGELVRNALTVPDLDKESGDGR